MMNNNNKKPQSQKDVKSKINSDLNSKNEIPQKRILSAIQPADKSVDSNGTFRDQLNNIAQDYLVRNNCFKSLEQFKEECQFATEQSNEPENLLLGNFDRGERNRFLKQWNRQNKNNQQIIIMRSILQRQNL